MSKLSPLEIARLLGPLPPREDYGRTILPRPLLPLSSASSSTLSALSSGHSDSASIFEIPPILDSICDNLTREDIWRCRSVSRTWLAIFGPYRWRDVTWANIEGTNLESTVIANEQWIRKLTIQTTDATFVKLQKTTNLKILNIGLPSPWNYMDYEDFSDEFAEAGYSEALEGQEDDLTRPESWIIPSILNLIHRNPRLHTLRIDCSYATRWAFGISRQPNLVLPPPHFNGEHALLTLKQHSCLRSIHIAISPFTTTAGLAVILKHLPTESLQELTIDRPACLVEQRIESPISTAFELPRPLFTSLRQLYIKSEWSTDEENVLMSLIQCCPNLVDISLSKFTSVNVHQLITTITTYCLKLETIESRSAGYPEYEILRLIQPYSRLREFTFGGSPSSQNLVLPALLEQCAGTLEVVQILEANSISSSSIARVLAECPRLRSLRVSQASDSVGITLSDVSQTYWASNRIEELKLVLLEESDDDDGGAGAVRVGSTFEEQRQETVKNILLLYRKLMTQRQLGKLALVWKSPRHTMPREVGMALIGGEVTEHRLWWMGLRWPTLKEIKNAEKEEKLKQMGFVVRDPSPTWHGVIDDEKGEEEEEDVGWEELDGEYTTYKSRNRHQQRSARGRR
ncbi:hypothetical protein EDD21DRAFT_385902 [Dissophora ornata]|nr:hypothetical protein EDD21DRAFT_385902 [Dissophora ornata]